MKNRILFVLLICVALIICLVVGITMTKNGQTYADTAADPRLRIDWTVTQGEGDGAELTVKVHLLCDEISVGARKDGVLSIGDQTVKFKTPAIERTAPGPHEVLLVERSVKVEDVSAAPSCTVEAKWKFDGTADGERLFVLDAKTVVQLVGDEDNQGAVGTGESETDTPETAPPPDTTPDTEPIPVPETDPETAPATEPEESAPETEETVDGPYEEKIYTLTSQSGTYIDLICEISVEKGADDVLQATATLYFDHYSLYSGKKQGCTFRFGAEEVTFDLEAIRAEDEVKHHVELAKLSVPCSVGDRIEVEAFMPYRGSYAGKPIENLVIDGSVVIEAS